MPFGDGTGSLGLGPGTGWGRRFWFGRRFWCCCWRNYRFRYPEVLNLTKEEQIKLLEAELKEIEEEKQEIEKALKELRKKE